MNSELSLATRRQYGAYYTPDDAAGYVARWIVRPGTHRVLEPSFGDGVFLEAVAEVAFEAGVADIHLLGAELSEDAFSQACRRGLIEGRSAYRGDFLRMPLLPVDAAVGNPPFVRLRHLSQAMRDAALRAARDALGTEMDPSGSTWMPFVLHASRFLRPGGRLAFVLPLEVTHVRYARPMWEYLAGNFSSLRVVRVFERVFTDLLQDVVLLFADGKGGTTTEVQFEAFRSQCEMLAGRGALSAIPVADLQRGERAFLRALLPEATKDVLDGAAMRATVPAGTLARFNIGYVSGDKEFFHPTPEVIESYQLPASSLRPTFGPARNLKGHGLWSSGLPASATQALYLPEADLSPEDEAYVAWGQAQGVAARYKCRVRSPWYAVPGVKPPDIVATVFSTHPLLLINNGGLVASNSLLCGYLAPGLSPSDFAAAWYSSLTLLFAELEVHSLGGGVLVLVPREASRIRVSRVCGVSRARLAAIDRALGQGNAGAAYESGDEALILGGVMTRSQLDAVHEGIRVLTRWRQRPKSASDAMPTGKRRARSASS